TFPAVVDTVAPGVPFGTCAHASDQSRNNPVAAAVLVAMNDRRSIGASFFTLSWGPTIFYCAGAPPPPLLLGASAPRNGSRLSRPTTARLRLAAMRFAAPRSVQVRSPSARRDDSRAWAHYYISLVDRGNIESPCGFRVVSSSSSVFSRWDSRHPCTRSRAAGSRAA